jgi:PAS domain S-box-containing protein
MSPDAIVVKSRNRIEFVNAAGMRLLGTTRREDIVGKAALHFVHPDSRTRLDAGICALLQDGKSLPLMEQMLVRTDGSSVDVELAASVVDFHGARSAQVVVRDITERKRAAQMLRESEERFRLIAETIAEVFWMADVKINRTVYVSPAYERIWGRTCDSLYQNPRSFLDAIHPDDHERVLAFYAKKNPAEPFDHEYRIVRPDGSVRWIWDQGYPVQNKTGEVLHHVGVAQDITARKHAEEKIHLLAHAVETTNEIISITDLDNRFTFVNTAFLKTYGYTAEEVMGQTPALLASPNNPPALCASIMASSRTQGWRGELLNRRKDGSEFPVSLNASPIRDANGQVVGLMGVARDITDRRSLEAQLRQAQKMEGIGQLAGGVAHDFNNILAAMMMQAELACTVENTPEEVREGLREIRTAAERAANLTRQLLLFSRKQVMQSRQLDLNEIVASLAKMLQRIIREDVSLKLHLHSTPLMTYADAGMLDQLLMNLAVNARDAMPKGGELIIETAERMVDAEEAQLYTDATPGRCVWLSVSDTGEGIPPEVLPQIFEPFFTTKEPGKGTGLGLATVFGVVKQHHGWLKVYSEVGKGTTFQIFLPASDASAEALAKEAVKPKPRGGTETILLVEDDQAVRMMTRIVLERNGYNVLEATNGVEAQQIWTEQQSRIALLLTDLVMPGGMDGRELAARLLTQNPNLKVIFTSGYSADIAGRELKLQAGQNFMQKPCPTDQLFNTVRNLLDR